MTKRYHEPRRWCPKFTKWARLFITADIFRLGHKHGMATTGWFDAPCPALGLFQMRWLLSGLILIIPNTALSQAPAQSETSPITKQAMIEIFTRDGAVTGRVIQGQDLIEIIKTTPYTITIRKSVIEGGLDFTQLPLRSPEAIDLPAYWTLEQRKDWFVQRLSGDKPGTRVVNNRIEIAESRISSLNAEDVLFLRNITFLSTTIEEGSWFERSTFDGDVSFMLSTFEGPAAFWEAIFQNDALFSGATFQQPALFSFGTYRKDTVFQQCQFWEKADFGSHFEGLLDFHNAAFFKHLNIREAEFGPMVDLSQSHIVRLNASQPRRVFILGYVDFRGAVISEAHFENLIFEQSVDFSNTQFGTLIEPPNTMTERPFSPPASHVPADPSLVSATIFRNVDFNQDVSFLRTRFWGAIGFEKVRVKGIANFTHAQFHRAGSPHNRTFSLSNVDFPTFRIHWPQFPPLDSWVRNKSQRLTSFLDTEPQAFQQFETLALHEEVEPLPLVLSNLEETFRQQGQLSDANAAYHALQLEKLSEAQGLDRILSTATWLVWGAPFGYGTKLGRATAWTGVLLLSWALCFFWKGCFQETESGNEDRARSVHLQILALPTSYITGEAAHLESDALQTKPALFVDALLFSLALLLKIGVGQRTISGRMLGIDLKYLVFGEWLVGYFWLGSLIVTLTNTQPVLSRLVTGAF